MVRGFVQSSRRRFIYICSSTIVFKADSNYIMLQLHYVRFLSFALITLLLAFDGLAAQDLHPSRRLSPVGIARTHIGDTYVKINYGRPYTRGRQIFGANTDSTTFLVPFGQIWRTGASESTEITVTGPVTMAGNALAAGTYSIYTEPGPEEWVIHISPQLGLDGTGIFDAGAGVFTPNVYQPENDVFAFTVPVHTLGEDETVDQFTISLEENPSGVDMIMRWERTEVRVPISIP